VENSKLEIKYGKIIQDLNKCEEISFLKINSNFIIRKINCLEISNNIVGKIIKIFKIKKSENIFFKLDLYKVIEDSQLNIFKFLTKNPFKKSVYLDFKFIHTFFTIDKKFGVEMIFNKFYI